MKTRLLLYSLTMCFPMLGSAQWNTNAGGTTYYTSTSNGYRVGIGINPATEKLHVAGNILSTGTITGSTINGTSFVSSGSITGTTINGTSFVSSGTITGTTFTGNGTFQSTSTNNISLRTNGTLRLTILNSDGNVGIGSSISTPLEKLHIDGNIRGNQSGAVRFSSGNGTMDFGAKSSSYGNIDTDRASFLFNKRIIVDEGIIGSYNEPLTFQAAGLTAMTILTTGEVGIGTTLTPNTKGYKLGVNGKIGAKEVEVETASWPDYVFDPKYRLTPLKDVELFINLNKHLPDVPSAEEIEKNGHRLGEMDATLLKKIEELTLYMIDLKKENEELKKRLEKLEQKN